MDKTKQLLTSSLTCIPFLSVFLFIIVGCTGPLKVTYIPTTAPVKQSATSPTIYVEPYKDTRESNDKAARRIGEVNTTVSDLTGPTLVLDRDVGGLVTEAFSAELKASGFKIISNESEKLTADYVLGGEVREFRLDLDARDEIAIILYSRLLKTKTGATIWSGEQKETGERFSGVMGNSRKTLNDYIVKTLSRAVVKHVTGLSRRIGMNTTGGVHASTGTRQISTKSIPAAPAPSEANRAITFTGKIKITTVPMRAKVYITDVYYGLSPISIDLKPGVYQFNFKLRGRKDATETVAIRKDYTMELEVVMENN